MKAGAYVALAAAARLYTPLIVLFSAVLLLTRAPGAGVGMFAGLAFAMALGLHALVFGIDAARVALAPIVTRLILALGLIAAFAGVAMPRLQFSQQVTEAGLFAVSAAGCGLFLLVLIGRAPTLRDEEWG